MKALDELIEKYSTALSNIQKAIGNGKNTGGKILVESYKQYIKDLETLKEQLKEQHKEDVISAYIYAQDDIVNFYDASDAEQYYQLPHETNWKEQD